MRLLVITPDRERAEELFGDMEQMAADIDYQEIRQRDWLEKLPEILLEKAGDDDKSSFKIEEGKKSVGDMAGTVDAVLLYTEEAGTVADEVRFARSVLTVPLLVCSRQASYYQEMQCLQAGADDYQSADCRTVILTLRIQRLIQIYQGRLSGMYIFGDLLENPEERQFYYGRVSLNLTVKEYQVLHWLVHSREDVVPREKLLYHIWGQEAINSGNTSRALDTVVKQLRKKLSGIPLSINTCYGRGYYCVRRKEFLS